ncbi:MAG TPA: hypothetical protein VG963_28530, partial [Polyangiaceae bacterium]|nr:hypothetical protein [Polyangiaceae bacterium]
MLTAQPFPEGSSAPSADGRSSRADAQSFSPSAALLTTMLAEAHSFPVAARENTMTQILECPVTSAARDAQETSASVDLGAVKARQQVMWSSGDFAVIGTTLQSVGDSLCEA